MKQLHQEALNLVGDAQGIVDSTLGNVPSVGIKQTPILQCLLSALSLRGDYATYDNIVRTNPENAWVLDLDSPLSPALKGETQTGAYNVFIAMEQCRDLPREMAARLQVTLGDSVSATLRMRIDWFQELICILPLVKQHTSMCAFKTLIGGWTTSHRMHEQDVLPCVFGCHDETDWLHHYLVCAPLWLICGQALSLEAPLHLGERICVVNPSVENLQLLALCFQLYHHTKDSC